MSGEVEEILLSVRRVGLVEDERGGSGDGTG